MTEANNQDIKHIKSQCQIIVYEWTTLDVSGDLGVSALSKSKPIDVSSRVMSATFSKSLANPAGTFSFTLANNTGIANENDWKNIIKPGMWCAIYMSQDGDLKLSSNVGDPKSFRLPKKLRGIGYIERISVKSELNANGGFDLVFEVSGRDFGIIYEKTELWQNVFNFEKTILDLSASGVSVIKDKTLDNVLKTMHQFIFNPKLTGGNDKNKRSFATVGTQWVLPSRLVKDLGIDGGTETYWGNLDVLDFKKTEATFAIANPTDFLTGNAWGKLKGMSMQPFHELFTEIGEDSTPKLIYRPIPWGIDSAKYPSLKKVVPLYKDIEKVKISAIDVLNFDIGEDDHSRYNSFLAVITNSFVSFNDNIAYLKDKAPIQYNDSIKRHGYRPMHATVDGLVLNAGKQDGATHPLIVQYNYLLEDYWLRSSSMETGTIELIGRNDIRLGKGMTFNEDVPYVSNKLYYIEEYTDSFVVDQTNGSTFWTQQVRLTRGAELADLASQSTIAARFSRRGEIFKKSADFIKDPTDE